MCKKITSKRENQRRSGMAILHVLLSQGQQTFYEEPDGKHFPLFGPISYNKSLFLQCESSQRQYKNKWACLCFNKTSCTKSSVIAIAVTLWPYPVCSQDITRPKVGKLHKSEE